MKWLIVLAVAVALGTFAAPFASTRPDGLNRVAADHGFAARAKGGSHYGRFAGLTGTLLVFGIGYGIARRVRRP